MSVKLFLLGRPGSGKSSAAKHIIKHIQNKGWSTYRLKDFDILQDMFEKDTQKRFKPSLHGGFDVVDGDVLDEALDMLNEKLLLHVSDVKGNKLLLIEFARDDYKMGLQRFSSIITQDAFFLCIDADLKLCAERIHQRMVKPVPPDDHYISEETLQKFYTKQVFPETTLELGRAKVLGNSGSWLEFTGNIDNFVKDIFKQ